MNTNAQNEEVLSLRISKNVGTAYGDKIGGDFTITGSGPDYILNLTLFFNGTQVKYESNNELKYRFNTKNYTLGLMNITLIGEDSEGTVYKKSIFKEFISPALENWIWIIVGGIALISGGLILASYIKKKQNEKQSATDKKNKIQIDIDKEFL